MGWPSTAAADEFDIQIVNDDLEQALSTLEAALFQQISHPSSC